MGTYTKSLILAAIFSSLLAFGGDLSLSSELIAPTRTLQDTGRPTGKLTVFSEPPGLDVFLDGTPIGKTPVLIRQLKPGLHRVRIKYSETEIYLESGRTRQVTLFRGTFINILRKAEEESGLARVQLTKTENTFEPTKEHTRGDLTPWERFLNRSSPHF